MCSNIPRIVPLTILTAMLLFSFAIGQTTGQQWSLDRKYVPPKEIGVDRAIEITKEPVEYAGPVIHAWANFEIERRLGRFDPASTAMLNNSSLQRIKYSLKETDKETWLKLVLDQQADNYARMCASIMAYDVSMDANGFLSEMLRNRDPHLRMNAALALVDAAKRHGDPSAREANRELAEFMNEQFVITDPKNWKAVEELGLGDQREMFCFLTIVSRHLAAANEDKIIPVLLTIAERDQRLTREMIQDLCWMDTPAAKQAMVHAIKSAKFDSTYIAESLARKDYQEAAPAIAELLGTDLRTKSVRRPDYAADDYEQRLILRALLNLNDKRVVPTVEEFIKSSKHDGAVIVAKRLIIQLTAGDPVAILLKELDPLSQEISAVEQIVELSRYKDERVLEKFEICARQNRLFYARFWAMKGIAEVPGKTPGVILRDLLEVPVPKDLILNEEQAPNSPPRDLEKLLHTHLKRLIKSR